jgi:hypothetical protein
VWRHVRRMTREEEGGEKVTHVGTIHSLLAGGAHLTLSSPPHRACSPTGTRLSTTLMT